MNNSHFITSVLISVAFKIVPFFSDHSSAVDSSFQIFNNISMNSAPPNATIQGSTTVCQNETPLPQITFTGSNGSQPYTFTYKINGEEEMTISTAESNSSVSIEVTTEISGIFEYTLISVEDSNGDSENIAESSAEIVILQSPDTSLGGTGSGSNFEGIPVFRQCSNSTTEFTFTNISSTASTNSNYTISWGDSSSDFNEPSWTSTTHTYDVGIYNLVYTIEGDNGCVKTANYTVFVGSNPAVSLGNPGNTDICNSNPLTFPITGTENNPPGTTYTVSFNDGSDPQIFNHPPPASITHTFVNSSCNTTSSDGSNSYENSFSATIVASNPCSTSSVGVVPIYVSVAPIANFDAPEIVCVNNQVCLNNTSIGEENYGSGSSCNTSPKIIWDISPSTGFVVSSGNIGDNFESNDPNVWNSGSDNLCLNFTEPGNYIVSLDTGNRCGIDTLTKNICVEDNLTPVFTTSVNGGCEPLSLTVSNMTENLSSCQTASYLWAVTYTPDFCGTTDSWEFTNGTNENSFNPSFDFETAGIYNISLTATNSCGSFETSQSVEVKQPPLLSLAPITDVCGSGSINLEPTVSSCVQASEPISYNWSFPGGTPANSDQLNPGTINYTTIGTYSITFSATNSCGTDSVTQSFSVNEIPIITNVPNNQSICSGSETALINLTASPIAATFSWSSNSPAGLTGFIDSGSSDTIPIQTLVNTTQDPITLIYTILPHYGQCTGSPVNVEIIVEPAPNILSQPQTDQVCQNGTTPDLEIILDSSENATYQWYENSVDNNTTGSPINGEENSSFSPPTDSIGETFYYVVITFPSGVCNEIISQTALIQVEESAQIDIEPINTQTICVDGNVDELFFTVSGGAGSVSYQWFSNTNNSNAGGTLISGATTQNYTPPTFDSIGNYYFYAEASYDASGCSSLLSSVAEIVVVQDPVITNQPLTLQSLCQNVTPQQLEVEANGGIGNNFFQWYVNFVDDNLSGTIIPGANTSTYTPPASEVGIFYYYCIISQEVSGCEVTSATGIVEINASPQFTTQPVSNELCLGESTNSLEVAYINGTGVPSYQWYENSVNSSVSGVEIAGANTSSYNPPVEAVGTRYYYCIVTLDSGGCSEIISNVAEITVNNTPSISDSDILICSGNSFEYIPDFSNGDIVPLNTLYTWTAPTINPAGSITGDSQQVIPSETIGQLLVNTSTTPATALYNVTPITGDCSGLEFNILVTVNPSISVSAVVNDNTCFQSNDASIETSVVGGVPFTAENPYLVSWTGPNGFNSTDEDIFNLEQGTYILNIDDSGGCPYSETFIIEEPEELVFNTVEFDPETISCFNSNDGTINISVGGGTEPYNFSWIKDQVPFSNQEDLSNLEPGNYEVSVSDANNCGPISLSFEIEEPPKLEISLNSKTDISCYGESTGEIIINLTGGRPDYIFSWTGPDNFTSLNQNIDSLAAGLYTLSVIDDSGCVEVFEVNLIQNDEINIGVTTTEIECYGDNDASIIINSISGGVSPYEIAWSNFGTGYNQTNLSAGTYIVTITDAENCSKEFPIVIEEAPLFLINPLVTQMSCSGANDASIALNFVGGLNPITVQWDDDPTAGTERNNLSPGVYSVTIIDGTQCVIQQSFTIYNISPLNVSAIVNDALDCDNVNSGSINLLIQGGTPPYDVIWSNGSTLEDLENIPPDNYIAQITDVNGCEVQGSWIVDRFQPLDLSVDIESEVDCEAKTVIQTFSAIASGGVPPYSFDWSSGVVSGINGETMTTDVNGLVLLEITDNLSCSTNFSFNVNIPVISDPNFETTANSVVNYGIYSILDPIQFTNTSTGDYSSVLWDFGDGNFSSEDNPTHVYLQVGNYVVTQTLTYPFGCTYTNLVTLVVEKGYKLIMPNAFTPNDDGLNDFFGPEHVGLKKLKLNIYDKWGSLIYSETGDSIRGWNGKILGEEAVNGNYYYTFSAVTLYEEEINKKGVFTFIN